MPFVYVSKTLAAARVAVAERNQYPVYVLERGPDDPPHLSGKYTYGTPPAGYEWVRVDGKPAPPEPVARDPPPPAAAAAQSLEQVLSQILTVSDNVTPEVSKPPMSPPAVKAKVKRERKPKD